MLDFCNQRPCWDHRSLDERDHRQVPPIGATISKLWTGAGTASIALTNSTGDRKLTIPTAIVLGASFSHSWPIRLSA
jgi:hypothetical protein